jgi:hypothetical protein
MRGLLVSASGPALAQSVRGVIVAMRGEDVLWFMLALGVFVVGVLWVVGEIPG